MRCEQAFSEERSKFRRVRQTVLTVTFGPYDVHFWMYMGHDHSVNPKNVALWRRSGSFAVPPFLGLGADICAWQRK